MCVTPSMNLLSSMGSHQTSLRGKTTAPPTFNINVVGDEGCGKTTIVHRYVHNQFVETKPVRDDKQLTELTPHIVCLSGFYKVGVVFWEVAVNVHNLIKREQYSHSDAVIVVVDSLGDASMSQRRQEMEAMLEGDVPVLVLFNCFRDTPEVCCHGDSGDLLSQQGLKAHARPRVQLGGYEFPVNTIELSDNYSWNVITNCLMTATSSRSVQVHPHTGDGRLQVQSHTGDGSVQVHPHTGDGRLQVQSHTGDGSVQVHPHTGDGSVHRAINQLLWKLVKRSQPKPYPLSPHSLTQLSHESQHSQPSH